MSVTLCEYVKAAAITCEFLVFPQPVSSHITPLQDTSSDRVRLTENRALQWPS